MWYKRYGIFWFDGNLRASNDIKFYYTQTHETKEYDAKINFMSHNNACLLFLWLRQIYSNNKKYEDGKGERSHNIAKIKNFKTFSH